MPSCIVDWPQSISFASHALERNAEPMLGLWQKIFNSTHWTNTEHLKTLIKMHAVRLIVFP
jgi:Zn-dependent M16 (insulinase) family peptidase